MQLTEFLLVKVVAHLDHHFEKNGLASGSSGLYSVESGYTMFQVVLH